MNNNLVIYSIREANDRKEKGRMNIQIKVLLTSFVATVILGFIVIPELLIAILSIMLPPCKFTIEPVSA